MIRKSLLLAGVALALCSGGAASADEAPAGRFYLHVGPGDVILAEGAKFYAGGAQIPGATLSANDSVTPIAELGYYVTPHIAVSFTGGYPPTAHVYGAGSISGVGELTKAVYGPMALTVHYHVLSFGRFRPYIGGGAVFMHIFSTSDRAFKNVDVHDHFGFAGQIGADYVLTNRWSLFLDFKKAYLRTTTTGTFGGTPIVAKVQLDPGVVSGGLGFRF